MSFTVNSSNQLTKFTISIGASQCSFTTTYHLNTPLTLTNEKFTQSGGEFTGTFQSASTVSGSFSVSNSYCGNASGTWSATK